MSNANRVLDRKKPRYPVHQFVSLYESGLSARQIARRFGCSQSTVLKYIRPHTKLRPSKRKDENTRFIARVDTDELLELYDAGYTMRELAERYGVSQATITNTVRDLGYETTPRKGRRGLGSHKLERWIYLLGRGQDNQVLDEMFALLESWRRDK